MKQLSFLSLEALKLGLNSHLSANGKKNIAEAPDVPFQFCDSTNSRPFDEQREDHREQ